MRPLFASSLLLAACAVLASCDSEPVDGASEASAPPSQVVNLYTARHYDSDLVLYERFTAETGIAINRIEGSADQLIERIRSEGAGSPADLFIAADAGALQRAQDAGIFQPYGSEAIDARIPANLREPSGLWTGLMRRARVAAYDPARVKPEEVDTYEELASARFRGKLCVRSADNIYNLSLVGALIEAWGVEKAGDWAKGIVANMARDPQGGDRDQIRAVSAGACEVAITNTYYFVRMASSEDAADRDIAARLRLAFPSLDGAGAHVNISGGGLVATAPNRANAVRLLEFFASADAQAHTAANNGEFPASPDVEWPAPVLPYADMTAHPMPVAAFARRQAEALALMSEAGWK
jgi:iron(III) transport system substrate-binding protein